MSDQPQLNPDALEEARFALTRSERAFGRDGKPADPLHVATAIVSAYLAVAQPELQANSKPNQNFEVVSNFDPRELNRRGWTCGCEPGNYDTCDECRSACNELADFLNRPEVKP